jgi:hypothetical protein
MSFSITRILGDNKNIFTIHNDLPYASGLESYNVYDSAKALIRNNVSVLDATNLESDVSITYAAPLCYIKCNLINGGTSPFIPLIVPSTVNPALPVYATAYVRYAPGRGGGPKSP